MTFVILTLLALAGAALLARGVRGRRVGEEPRCRRCGYDLTGAPADSTRCPECGADARDAVVGRRVRSARAIVAGAALFLIASLVGGTLGVARARGVDWKDHWPDAWLIVTARRAAVAGQVDAIGRLIARDGLRPLSAAHRADLARAIVSCQRQPTRRYDPKWGDWLAARAVEGTVPADVVQAFFANVFAGARATFRPSWRSPVTPPYEINFPVADGVASFSNGIAARLSTNERVLLIDGHRAGPVPGSVTCTPSLGGGTGVGTWGMAEPSREWERLAPGTHAVEWTCPLRVFVGDEYVRDPTTRPQLARIDVAFRGTVTIYPLSDPDAGVARRADPALADAIRAAMGEPTITLPRYKNWPMIFTMHVGAVPCDIAFDIFIKQGDGPEQKASVLTRRQRDTAGLTSLGFDYQTKLTPGPAELIFRASSAAARGTVDVFEIWDGEVRVPATVVEAAK